MTNENYARKTAPQYTINVMNPSITLKTKAQLLTSTMNISGGIKGSGDQQSLLSGFVTFKKKK